jgi:hypothetical protein
LRSKCSWTALFAAATVLAFAPLAHAAGTGCEAFAWPLDAERAALSAPDVEKLASGAAPGAWTERAFVLELKPVADVKFDMPPGGKPKGEAKETFGGVLSFVAPAKATVYQVTLSGEGWIDVIQDGAQLATAGHTGAKECPGLRKSVRFEVAASPVVLQISGATTQTIGVALRPAP